MVRVITQETYDEVVKENMEEFEMTAEEAVKDATAQFEAQGVDLSNVIKDLTLDGDKGAGHRVSVLVAELTDLAALKADDEEITKTLQDLKTECQKDLARRVRAAKDGAYTTLMNILEARQKLYKESKSEKDAQIMVAVLDTLNALMDVQPDLLDERGVNFIFSVLTSNDSELLASALQWAGTCCLLHEGNRQALADGLVAEKIRDVLEKNKNVKVVSASLRLTQRLTLDDDVRVQCGRTHERARGLAAALLQPLTGMMAEQRHPPLVSPVLRATSCLLVRHELCAAAAPCVPHILDILTDNIEDAGILQHVYTLISALAGNDDVKRSLMGTGLPVLLVAAMNRHAGNSQASALALKCVSVLTLREPTHSEILIDAGAADVIVACLNNHRGSAAVQKYGCWAVRNLVSRRRDLSASLLNLGVESILREAGEKFKQDFGFDVKSALRDLGCDVALDEQWRGKGVQMEN